MEKLLVNKINLAACGFFFEGSDDQSVQKRNYCIRRAHVDDVESLCCIEIECWGPLQVTGGEILQRLQNNDQWVATVDDVVAGVIYMQKIESLDVMLQGISFERQGTLHRTDHSVIQLLGVSVKHNFAHLQIGQSLRDFVLDCCKLDPAVREVVAVTRCSKAASVVDRQNYPSWVHSGSDSIIGFHLRGGARIVHILENYRPNDDENFGCGILISYAINHFGSGDAIVRLNSTKESFTLTQLRDVVEMVLNPLKREQVHSMDRNSFLDCTFMGLGLDSLLMMDLRGILAERTGRTMASTVLFDFPTPQLLLAHINEDPNISIQLRRGCLRSTPAGSAAVGDSDEIIAISGLSCRLPGQRHTSTDSFFNFLCSEGDLANAVSCIPDDWTTKTRHAAFLDEELASTFDPSFFGLTDAETASMDPMQRILLEISHEALAEAGVFSGRQKREETGMKAETVGVFVGLCNNEWIRRDTGTNAYSSTSSAQSIAANRISFCLGLRGPSLVVDTACSSSLSALHTAVNAIKCGDCDVAVVAAADLIVSQYSIEVLHPLKSHDMMT